MENLSDRNIMPNFKKLREEGTFIKMRSSLPEVSSVAWSSIITGKNPGEHGVYGFTDLIKRSYTLSFHNFKKLKSRAFWQMDGSKKYVIINVPSTYPAQRINGFLVSGFVSPDLEKAVYPSSYVEKLRNLGYNIDVDSEKVHKSKMLFFKELFETLEARIKTCMYLLKQINWDILMFVITGTDRLEHFLWDAYQDKAHEWHHKFIEFFEKVDDVIGTIASKIGEETPLIILSDHGMEAIETNVNINTYLANGGYLTLEHNPRKAYGNIKRETKAFALDPSRIYLNKKGKYPRGSVTEREEPKLIEELIEFFSQLRKNGEKVLRKIYRKNEIYHGKELDDAPDLVLLPNPGFNLKASLFKKELFEKDHLTGKHTQENAFLYVKNCETTHIPSHPSVEDVLPIFWNVN
jgi:predicted AlkP superfamily phosphohydrolase/phosphomutase